MKQYFLQFDYWSLDVCLSSNPKFNNFYFGVVEIDLSVDGSLVEICKNLILDQGHNPADVTIKVNALNNIEI